MLYQIRYTIKNKHIKWYSTWPIIWEMQIKATMKYHSTHIRIFSLKENTKCCEDVEHLGFNYITTGNAK